MSLTDSNLFNKPDGRLRAIHTTLMRRKIFSPTTKLLTLNLNLYDITGVNLSTTLAVGPYYLIGHFMTKMGPGLIVAYLLSALVAFLSALNLSELTSHGGGSGGPYTTIYQQIGELPAFLVGWILLVRCIVCNANNANILASILRDAFGFSEERWINTNNTFLHDEFFAQNISIFGSFISLILTFIFVLTMNYLKKAANTLIAINLFLFVLVLASTGSVARIKNWAQPAKAGCGEGGFFPYGFTSILDNTKLVYVAYVGIDSATYAGSECYEPERVIPIAMLLSTMILLVLYVLQSVTHSLCWHYCDQDISQAIVYVLKKTGLEVFAAVPLALIPLILMGAYLCMLYPITRLFYSFAEDGLLFSLFLKTDKSSRHPINAMIVSGIISSLFSLFFNDVQLSLALSLLSMLSQAATALSVIYLRHYDIHLLDPKKKSFFRKLFNLKPKALTPNKSSFKIVTACCCLLIVLVFPLIFLAAKSRDEIVEGGALGISLLISAILVLAVICIIISRQPQSDIFLTYKIRYYPLVPFSSIILNVFFSVSFGIWTWLRCLSLIGIGLFIYVTYGVWNSKQQNRA